MRVSKTRWEALLLVALVTPFLLLGARDVWKGIRGLADYGRTGTWEPVSVALTDVHLLEPAEGDGDFVAAYTYRIGGREYAGRYVGVSGGGSSDVRRAWAHYDTLTEHFDQSEPLQALVNPASPAESVLFWEKEPWMLGAVFRGLGFLLGGFGLAGVGVCVLVGGQRLDADRPWLIRRDWVRGTVSSFNAAGVAILLSVGLFTNALMVALLTISDGAPPALFWALWGLVVLVPAFLFLRALRLTGRRLTHGAPVLHLSEVPVVPGRSVEAVMVTRRPVEAGKWHLELRCIVPNGPHLNGAVRQAAA